LTDVGLSLNGPILLLLGLLLFVVVVEVEVV